MQSPLLNLKSPLLLLLGVLLCGPFSTQVANAQAIAPLNLIERDLGPNSNWQSVLAAAGNGTQSNALRFGSVRVENRIFEGPWTALDNRDRLAIFSDDGCTITITPAGGAPQVVLSNFGRGQTLANLRLSLIPLNFVPTAGTTYTIRVQYSNISYTGAGDVDGLTLFRYRDETPAPPVVYDPQLNSDQHTSTTARLFWTPFPVAANFISYSLFRDVHANVTPSDTTRVGDSNTVSQTEIVDGKAPLPALIQDTTYFYKLRVRFREAGVEVTRDYPVHELKTLKDDFRVTLSGFPRACAGHIQDEVHTVSLEATAQRKNAAGTWENAPDTDFRLLLDTSGAQGSPPQLLKRETVDGTTTETPVASPLGISSDSTAKFAVRVLSGQQVSNNTILQVQVKRVSGGANPQTTWEEVASQRLEFAASESKRLFGIVNWDQGFTNDNGWYFDPIVFDQPNQKMECRLYLRFRKDTDDAKVDRDYFVIGGNPRPSVDTNSDGRLSDAERNAATVRGSHASPLVNSPGAGSEHIWFPVDGHTVRIRLQSLEIPGDSHTAPVAGLTPNVVTFCDADGNPLRVNAAGEPEAIPAGQPILIPEFLPVKVINGVATFYLKSGLQISQTTKINLRVQDATQIR